MLISMATHSATRKSAPITSIQPGGGLGLWFAQLWGSRLWLRNVLDARTSSGMTLHFTPHPLRLARAGLTELVVFGLLFGLPCAACVWLALEVHELFWVPAGILAALLLFVVSFFRDPERVIPTDPLALVSPADGTITDVGEVSEEDYPGGKAFRIGMFLSVFNVHVNRIPRSGTVLGVRYFPGKFLDARDPSCSKENEQLWIDIGEGLPGRFIRVKQISGAIARRIVCWLRPGEQVQAGLRLGMIKFGSRTEVYLPIETVGEVLVKVGDAVRGGSTILLRMKNEV